MEIFVSAIAQGILWGILSLGLFISFRILDVADMTTEGAFPLGASVAAITISGGTNPYIAVGLAFLAGSLAGLVTGFLITVCKIPSLLAGILTMTGLLSINIRVMGKPNMSIPDTQTIFSVFDDVIKTEYFSTIFAGLLFVTVIMIALFVFFKTDLGQAIVATGDNAQMATSFGINTKSMVMIGLMLSNGIIALSGAIIAQNNGYADVNSGLGVIVIALAAIIIGEVIFREATFFERLLYTVIGAIIYRVLLVGVLKLKIIEPNDFKLFSALVITLFLTLPHLKHQFPRLRKEK